jgi:hypothetical protein
MPGAQQEFPATFDRTWQQLHEMLSPVDVGPAEKAAARRLLQQMPLAEQLQFLDYALHRGRQVFEDFFEAVQERALPQDAPSLRAAQSVLARLQAR